MRKFALSASLFFLKLFPPRDDIRLPIPSVDPTSVAHPIRLFRNVRSSFEKAISSSLLADVLSSRFEKIDTWNIF